MRGSLRSARLKDEDPVPVRFDLVLGFELPSAFLGEAEQFVERSQSEAIGSF